MTYKKEAGSVAKSRHYKIIRVQFSGYILNIVGVDCGEEHRKQTEINPNILL